MKALIDGDIITYRAGFASDAGAAKAGIEQEDVSYVLHSVKLMLEDIKQACAANEHEIYLTGDNNFRNELATIQKYKDRPSDKPSHYTAIREYLVDQWGAVISDGNEADDLMGLNQTDNTVICSIDKDLLMIPGYHYNFVKKTYTDVSEEEGLLTFYRQLLTGDKTDTIPGIRGIGPKKAEKILPAYQPEKMMWQTVRSTYKQKAPQFSDDNVIEIGRLLWIQRPNRTVWSPP